MKKYRRGVFCVVYAKDKEKIKYLILHRKLHWKGWEFPKGGIEKGEKILDGVKREIREETGLKIRKIKKYNFSGKYKYNKKFDDRKNILGQTYVLFSVEVNKENVKIDSKEHDKSKWVDFKTASRLLTWPNQRKCLRVVESHIN